MEKREVISVHIGQCGVQVGEQCWRLFAREHGLQPATPHHRLPAPNPNADHLHTFFTEVGNDQVVPRAVFGDLESSAVDALRAGRGRGLFRADDLVAGNDGTEGLFAGGMYWRGRPLADLVMGRIRRLAGECDRPQGFMLYHGTGGGAGSGLTSRLLELLSDEFPKLTKLSLSTFPSPSTSATTVVEPYNAVLATHYLLEHNDVDFVFDNAGLADMCQRKLALQNPSRANFNHLIAQTVSSATASMRFGGDDLVCLDDFLWPLVPFPRLQFLLQAHAPVLAKGRSVDGHRDVTHLACTTLQPANFLARCDPRVPEHYYLAMCMLLRGDVNVYNQNAEYFGRLKCSPVVQFSPSTPWHQQFRSMVASHVPLLVPEGGEMAACPRSVLNICNNTAVSGIFHNLGSRFDALLAKRSFVHWFEGEGMEEGELVEAREDVAALGVDYEEVANGNTPGDDGDEY